MAGDAEWFMDYHNSDGSIAEMCGNGVRAFARYLTVSGLVSGLPARQLPIATRAGVVAVDVDADLITVDMPVPVVGPVNWTAVAGVIYRGPSVTVGNPNLVITVPDRSTLAALDLRDQPLFDTDTFPSGANVEFVTAGGPDRRRRRSTSTCGSTSAVRARRCPAAPARARWRPWRSGRVGCRGVGRRGRARRTADHRDRRDRCRLTGPAVIVATGEINVADVAVDGSRLLSRQ